MIHRSPRLALLLLLLGFTAFPAAAAGEVEFITPRHNATALGPSTIELRVRPPAGLTVVELLITVDEQDPIRLTAPPWKASWDAGDGARGHRLEALLVLSDGSRSRAIVRTSRLRINQVEEVDLVNLYPVARDRGGGYVSDLEAEDFEILEMGKRQEIKRFTTERKPLRIGIVLDTSLSMARGGRLESAQKAARGFLEVLEPGDEGMLVTFNDVVSIAQELTSDRTPLDEAIQATVAIGGTALYDAIWRTSKRLEAFDGRRVLVLLSDGKDEAANGFEPGSLHTLDEALDQALRSEIMVFAIGLGRHLDQKVDFAGKLTLEQVLNKLASSTGGRALISPRAGQLRKAFRAVAEDLRNQYSIAYSSSDPTRDGRWRRLSVSVPGRDVEVISRKGYFAGAPRETGKRASDNGTGH